MTVKLTIVFEQVIKGFAIFFSAAADLLFDPVPGEGSHAHGTGTLSLPTPTPGSQLHTLNQCTLGRTASSQPPTQKTAVPFSVLSLFIFRCTQNVAVKKKNLFPPPFAAGDPGASEVLAQNLQPKRGLDETKRQVCLSGCDGC